MTALVELISLTVRVMTFLSAVTVSLPIILQPEETKVSLQTHMDPLQALCSTQSLAGGLVLVVSRGGS